MPIIYTDLTTDEADKIEDELSGVVYGKVGGNGGGDHDKKEVGGKTYRAMRKEEAENSQEKRRDTAEKYIIKMLKHLPKSEHEEETEGIVAKYTDWLTESLRTNQPVVNVKDLEFSQFSAGGPGGQNVNKVSNAVLYKHLITGMFANSRDSRNTIENRNHAAELLYENLDVLVRNWKLILSDIPSSRWEDAIRTFVKKGTKEKVAENLM